MKEECEIAHQWLNTDYMLKNILDILAKMLLKLTWPAFFFYIFQKMTVKNT